MGNKTKRKKHRHSNKKRKILIIKVVTLVMAVLLAITLGILIPKNMNKDSSEIEMSKEYIPGEEISSSLKKNEEIEVLIDVEEPKDVIAISKTDETEIIREDQDGSDESDSVIVEEVGSSSELDASTNNDDKDTVEDAVIPEDLASAGTGSSIDAKEKSESLEESKTKEETSTEETSDEDVLSEETNEEDIREETEEKQEVESSQEDVQYVKDEWVDDMIQENKDSIDSNDLAAGALIYNKLDTGYLFGLAEGGMTPEEEAEAMIYLESNLTADEYILAKALFSKYVGLAN